MMKKPSERWNELSPSEQYRLSLYLQALEPFAAAWNAYGTQGHDTTMYGLLATAADFKRAADALNQQGGE